MNRSLKDKRGSDTSISERMYEYLLNRHNKNESETSDTARLKEKEYLEHCKVC